MNVLLRPYYVPRAIPELSIQSEQRACPLDLIWSWVEMDNTANHEAPGPAVRCAMRRGKRSTGWRMGKVKRDVGATAQGLSGGDAEEAG